ncbi:hypothetical protein ALC56_11170, partial [Trachymyrmex septentrionalis]
SSSTAHARGGREQGVHLLETCSFYPLLIERSALGSTGVDWTHQQPLTVAPSRRPLPPPRLIYVRMCVCVCVCVCVRVCVYARACCIHVYARMRRESTAAKRRPKMLRPGKDGHPGGGKAFPRVSVLRAGRPEKKEDVLRFGLRFAYMSSSSGENQTTRLELDRLRLPNSTLKSYADNLAEERVLCSV